jgi:hypothetical protein
MRYALSPYIKQTHFVFKGLIAQCTDMRLTCKDDGGCRCTVARDMLTGCTILLCMEAVYSIAKCQ